MMSSPANSQPPDQRSSSRERDLLEYIGYLEAEQKRRSTDAAREAEVQRGWAERRQLLYRMFPDEGPLRRELYPKHLEFYRAGREHNERAMIAANRVGKTVGVGYEASCHLTGWYAHWWEGFRFNRPIVAWACGEDVKTVRESLQPKLLGPDEARGTGLIPGDAIDRTPSRGGIPGAIDYASIRSAHGGMSRLVFKAYEQGREAFESTEVDVLIFDEEPPLPIYTAGLTRTLSTVPGQPNGLIMCSFTPLLGISATILHFLPGGAYPATEELRRTAWGW